MTTGVLSGTGRALPRLAAGLSWIAMSATAVAAAPGGAAAHASSVPTAAATAAAASTGPAADPSAPSAAPGGGPDADDPQTAPNGIAEGSDIVVTGTRANLLAPVTESLRTTQPQSVVSRSFIEDSLPATADFNQIALISPSVSNTGNANGTGLSESKAQIRGFQDGEYNVTYDGVPFGDTNDPTHHSNTFFPSNTIETLVVDRGPGNASQLGQATFGGNINLFSRATRPDPGIELKGTYGTFDTYLLRGLAQTGAIAALGGTEMVVSAQHVRSDGARTFSPFRSDNAFGKIAVPIGPSARLTVLATYNENTFNQPDNDGVTLGQAARYGRYFSLNDDPASQNYRRYNRTHKTTDFEIARFEADLAPRSAFENRAYTYSYDNETLSGSDPTIYGTAFPTAAGPATAAQIAAAVAAADAVTVSPAAGGMKAVTAVGVPGYTKTNRYRVFGDIAKTRLDFGFGALTVGAWLEWSHTYRQQRDVNLATGLPNYVEKAVTSPSGTATPQNVRFDQKSETNHTEEFVELELRPLPGLVITPGYKHVDFNRRIDAPYNQTTRYAQRASDTYAADLPFATVNYAVGERISAYAQFAKGFLAPPLNVLYVANPTLSTVEPERSTNYQAGAVYHGRALSLDADVYRIDFANKFASFTSPVPGQGVIFVNQGAVTYKGIEGQATYALPSGFAVFANGSRNYAKTDNAGQPRQQVAKAPEYTAAGGVLYKRGPIRFSLIDKWVGRQWFVNPGNALYGSRTYRSEGYNTAIASVRYDIGPVRLGAEINNVFDSRRVTSISQGKGVTDPVTKALVYPYDQYVFQTGRAVTGDVTLTF